MLTHSHSDGEFPIYSQGEVIWCVDVVICAEGICQRLDLIFCSVAFCLLGLVGSVFSKFVNC